MENKKNEEYNSEMIIMEHANEKVDERVVSIVDVMSKNKVFNIIGSHMAGRDIASEIGLKRSVIAHMPEKDLMLGNRHAVDEIPQIVTGCPPVCLPEESICPACIGGSEALSVVGTVDDPRNGGRIGYNKVSKSLTNLLEEIKNGKLDFNKVIILTDEEDGNARQALRQMMEKVMTKDNVRLKVEKGRDGEKEKLYTDFMNRRKDKEKTVGGKMDARVGRRRYARRKYRV